MGHRIRVQLDLRIPMRDGVELYAALYRPPQGDQFPVLLIRSPYGTEFPRYVPWMERFVESGYAVILQDCRGRYQSGGVYEPYIHETSDGYDTQQWIGAQSWCDGNIGTFGSSYPGFTQILPATLRSPYVKGLVPMAHQEDNYGHLRYNGLLQLQNVINFIWIGSREVEYVASRYLNFEELYRHLPILTAPEGIAERPFYDEIIGHPRFDEFWSSYSMKGRYSEVDVPAHFVTGWYDNLVHEGFKCFTGWKSGARSESARRRTKMLVGPWTHSQVGSCEPYGDVEFGPDAAEDIPGFHLRWFDQRLKGMDTGIDEEPALRIFVMGENRWRQEEEWPLARTLYTRFYLHSGGRANSLAGDGSLTLDPPGDEPFDSYTYDPSDPVPTLGGPSMFIENTGPRDRRPLERRDDVLVFSTQALEQDLEVTGPITLTLHAASSARDTDFTAALIDVHPGGKAIIISDGIVRGRFRESYENPALLEPGRVYEYQIAIWETSNLFKAGNHIRVEVSSSNFPRFDRNLNTGGDPGRETHFQVAEQTVHHSSHYPSHITLPVIPR